MDENAKFLVSASKQKTLCEYIVQLMRLFIRFRQVVHVTILTTVLKCGGCLGKTAAKVQKLQNRSFTAITSLFNMTCKQVLLCDILLLIIYFMYHMFHFDLKFCLFIGLYHLQVYHCCKEHMKILENPIQ